MKKLKTRKKKEDLIDKLNELEDRFLGDPEVIELTSKLKERFDTMYNKTFTNKEIVSEEFDEVSGEYYLILSENDPDDTTIFQVMWFK